MHKGLSTAQGLNRRAYKRSGNRKMAAGILREKLHLEEKDDFIAERKGILDPDTLTKEERAELIRREPAYGNIICRCEMVTEGEIIDAIRRPLGAKSLDGVKRRTRAGMGAVPVRFLLSRTMEILARELGISMADITKSAGRQNWLSVSIRIHCRRRRGHGKL